MKEISSLTTVTPRKLIEYLGRFVEIQLDGNAGNPPPSMIWGPPGIGKSDILRQVAEKKDLALVDVRLAQREPVDMRGLPVPNMKEKSVDWYTSSEWPRDPGSKGIIFFDELTAADRMNQAASYEFILDRRLGKNYVVPDGWYICAAGNRVSDHAVATQMSSALANRFIHFNLEADIDSWCAWAETNGIHPVIIGFLRFKPELLHAMPNDESCQQGWPSPRSWERVDMILKKFPKTEHQTLVTGLVGEAAAALFQSFMNSSHRFDADVYKAMSSSGTITLPDRDDQLYAWCAAAANTLVKRQEDFPRLLDGFTRVLRQVSPDFAQMMLQMVQGDRLEPDNRRALFCHRNYIEWAKANGGRVS